MVRMVTFFLLCISSCNFAEEKNNDGEIRGVWLTNVDSEVLSSRENIRDAMQFLADHHFNLVCPVVWNKARTLYRSELMDSLFGITIDSLYGDRDPLQELIAEAHQRDIAVIAWFEFGFSSSYNMNGGHILKKFPHWAAKDEKGDLLTKNGFEWMNAYHEDVQAFICGLIREVASRYAVDGIQGDDRLPAQPSEGGYSPYTISLYKKEHQGISPPKNHLDRQWLKWRSGKLNKLAGDIYDLVKNIDKDILVTWAPSIYPWAYEEYLQEWPVWVKEQHADLVIPQHYRYSIEEYRETLDSQLRVMVEFNLDKAIFYPGILLNIADYLIPEDYLYEAISYNRQMGINGEIFFFFEGLRKEEGKLARFLKDNFYQKRATLPFIPRYQKLNAANQN